MISPLSKIVATSEQGILVLLIPKGFKADRRSDDFPAAYKPAVGPGTRLILDLSELESIDSSHLAALVICFKRVVEAGGNVVFCELRQAVKETFQVTRLDRVFTILSTRAEAIQQLTGKSPAKI